MAAAPMRGQPIPRRIVQRRAARVFEAGTILIKNFDTAGAFRRALPSADRIGATFRGAGFSLRISAHKRLKRDDAQPCVPPETRAEEHAELYHTPQEPPEHGLRSLLRIASILREALADLRVPGITMEAPAPQTRQTRPDPLLFLNPARPRMDASELALAQIRASIRVLRQDRSRTGNWVIVLTPEIGDGPVPPVWISELNCQHFTVFEVEMLNDLVISAGSSIACIVLDGRLENRALAESAIQEAKQRYPAIRAVLLDAEPHIGDGAPSPDSPFDVRLGLRPTRARLKWAIVAGGEASG